MSKPIYFTLIFLLFQIILDFANAGVSNLNVSAGLSIQSPLSRLINSPLLYQNPSRIQFENYKAIVGETVRLECPQPNPTWFFRRMNSEEPNANTVEDLIVTRHGIINGDYKYKIMCHMTLKHKVIIINNIDFEEEGLYTCLYTLPNEVSSNSILTSDSAINQPIQYRYVFNVTVYSKFYFRN